MRIVEAVLFGALIISSAAACGQDPATAERAPELAALLDTVDAAVVTGNDARIRQRVDDLVAATIEARDTGDLDAAQAEEILSAAAALIDGLSSAGSSPSEEPSSDTAPPPASPSSPPATEETQETEETEETGKPEKHDEGQGEDKGKDKGRSDGKTKP